MAYNWPGNVRQLRNIVENMVVLSSGDKLTARDLPSEINPRITAGPTQTIDSLVGISIEQAEKELIRNTLKMTDGNREQASKILGIGERDAVSEVKRVRPDVTLMDTLPYETPAERRSKIDVALGWLTVAGIAAFFCVGFAMGGLADTADQNPIAANIVGWLLATIFFIHVVLVSIRLRIAWRRRDLPKWLGFAAIIDGLVIIAFVIGLLIDQH